MSGTQRPISEDYESPAEEDLFREYGGDNERDHLISHAIISYTKMKHTLDERLTRRRDQNNSPIKYNPFQGQGRIILALSPDEGKPQVRIAQELEVKAQTLSVAIQKLENGGFVERKPDPADARSRLVFLTDKGCDLKKRLAEEEKYSESMFEALDDEELSVFTTACEKLTSHLAAEMKANDAVQSFLNTK